MDLVDGLITYAGYFVIIVICCASVAMYAKRQDRLKTIAADPRKCSCGHGYGAHAAKGCQADYRRPHYMHSGTRNGHEWVKCPCLRFDGTPPIDVLGWKPPNT